jgi:hypothetical protein
MTALLASGAAPSAIDTNFRAPSVYFVVCTTMPGLLSLALGRARWGRKLSTITKWRAQGGDTWNISSTSSCGAAGS